MPQSKGATGDEGAREHRSHHEHDAASPCLGWPRDRLGAIFVLGGGCRRWPCPLRLPRVHPTQV